MLNFALVGCGRICDRHARVIQESDYGRLIAVADPRADRAKAASEKYSVPHFADAASMVEQHPEIEVLNILTPSGNHAQNVIDYAELGKHLVVEKPMALRLQDADRMIRRCDEQGIKLFVVKQNRYNLPVVHLRRALEQGRFGKLVMGTVRVRWCRHQHYYDQDAWRGTWDMDGGVLTNQASHHVDLLEWMMGDVESVMAKSATRLVDIEVEDTAAAVLKFTNGALGVIEATTATRPKDLEGSLTIMGERGVVEIGGFAVNKVVTWQFDEELPGDAEIRETGSENPPNVYGFGHQAYLGDVVEAIKNNKRGMVDGIQGRRSLELINALYESIETGKEVKLRFTPRRSRLGTAQGEATSALGQGA